MKLIIKAIDIPLESIVTKVSGTKRYRIQDVVNVEGITPTVIRANKNSRILFPLEMSAVIETVDGDTELIWEPLPIELCDYIHDRYPSHF